MADTHTAYIDTDALMRQLDAAEAMPAAARLRARSYQLLRLPPDGTAVDVGCGTARAVAELAEHAAHAIGVDLDPAMLAAARRRFPGIDVRAADATELPLDDGQAHGYRADKVYHVDSDQPELTRRIVHARADTLPHPRIARGYRNLLLDAGFHDVGIEVHTVVFTGTAMLPMPIAHATAAYQVGAITRDQADSWISEQTQRAHDDRLLVAIPMFLATATR